MSATQSYKAEDIWAPQCMRSRRATTTNRSQKKVPGFLLSRKWATERKHLPDVDAAEAGGWKTVETLKTAYQQAYPETILRVVLEPVQLREVR